MHAHLRLAAFAWLASSATVDAQLLQDDPDLVLQADQAGAAFGTAVAFAGDVNGDGFSDVLVGAPFFDFSLGDEGAAFLFLGSAEGLATTPAWFASGSTSGARFGEVLDGAGDVNGDGYDDVVIGASGEPVPGNGSGLVHVYLGSASGLDAAPAVVLEPGIYALLEGAFGIAVTGRGDVDGDGFADVFVGLDTDGCGHGGSSCLGGTVLGYFGSPAGLPSTPSWASDQGPYLSAYGTAVSLLGDVDADGFDDLAVGAPDADFVDVFRGSPTGPVAPPVRILGTAGDSFGVSIDAAGDTDGDGYPDLLVGANGFFGGGGAAFLYRGSASGISSLSAWSYLEFFPDAAGTSVAGVGDLDRDGLAEVMLGAPLSSRVQTEEGRLLVFRGDPQGATAGPSWMDEPDLNGALLGDSTAGRGDVDGDGFLDVLGGAPGIGLGQAEEGAVVLFHGQRRGSAHLRGLQQRLTSDAAPIALGGRSDASDGFRVHATARLELPRTRRLPPGPRRAWLEGQAVPVGDSFDGAPLFASAPRPLRPGPLSFDVTVGGLQPDTVHAWRVRVATDDPGLPPTVWFTLPGRGASEGKVRTAP